MKFSERLFWIVDITASISGVVLIFMLIVGAIGWFFGWWQ